MFDPVTSSLIRNAPVTEGFDLGRLPELLADAYTQMATLRLRLEGVPTEVPSDLEPIVAQLRVLATALEIHACVAPVDTDRRSAAFVAATAHRLLFEVSRLFGGSRNRLTVSSTSISPDLSAALLFLAAGYPADAAEAIVSLPRSRDGDPRFPAVAALACLARGELEAVLSLSIEVPDDIPDEDRAELTLWRTVLWAISLKAYRILGQPTSFDTSQAAINAVLQSVRDAAVIELDIPGLGQGGRIFSSFAGPYHAATLLLAASAGLDGFALVDAPVPDGPDPDRWRSFIRARARKMPYVWANHMEAIKGGLLTAGKSAAISYPTGAGKSTLSELKIAAAVLRGQKVVYIAPTLALVGQVSQSAKLLIESLDVEAEVDAVVHEDQLFADFDETLGGEVWVMTPERCLLLMGLFPERFAEVGLIVFDECHMVHPKVDGTDRRSLDAMLCLMRLLAASPTADALLMSAMMSNCEELAGWLRDCHGRDALCFDAPWKPTRQARASLLFDRAEIANLKVLAAEGWQARSRLPQSLMKATPYTLVGLRQTWQSNGGADYRILRLTEVPTRLTASRSSSGRVDLTINATDTAVDVAAISATKGLKTIVFLHTPRSVPKAIRRAAELVRYELELSQYERELLSAMAEELGGEEHVVRPNGIAGGHFGSLFPLERSLVESAFKRRDGISVLFSTNTLAQGMNLPADQVIIAKTGTYDASAEQYRQVDVHELLNAAGRAGRAGHASNGFVLVIPDKLVDFDAESRTVGGTTIRTLKDSILAQDDRCLKVGDPIESVLDRCQVAPAELDSSIDTFLLRLPTGTEEESALDASRRFLGRTLSAYRAAQQGRKEAFEIEIESAVARQSRLFDGHESDTFRALSSATGMYPSMVHSLVGLLQAIDDPAEIPVGGWVDLAVDWISANPASVQLLKLNNEFSPETTKAGLAIWTSGRPLVELELALGTASTGLGQLDKARKFVRGAVREVSYVIGLFAQIAKKSGLDNSELLSETGSVAALLVREGFERVEPLVLYQFKSDSNWTRVRAHREAGYWLAWMNTAPFGPETFLEAKRRVMAGITEYMRRQQSR